MRAGPDINLTGSLQGFPGRILSHSIHVPLLHLLVTSSGGNDLSGSLDLAGPDRFVYISCLYIAYVRQNRAICGSSHKETSAPVDTDTLNSRSPPSNERGMNPNLGEETTRGVEEPADANAANSYNKISQSDKFSCGHDTSSFFFHSSPT